MADCIRPYFLHVCRMKKCDHNPEEKTFLSVAMNETVTNILRKCHDDAGQNYDEKHYCFTAECSLGLTNSDEKFQVQGFQSVGDLISTFSIKCIHITCEKQQTETAEATKKAVDAFQLLGSGVKDDISKTGELYNDLLDSFKERGLDWPRRDAEADGKHFRQVLTNSLWYIFNQHEVINQAALRKKCDTSSRSI